MKKISILIILSRNWLDFFLWDIIWFFLPYHIQVFCENNKQKFPFLQKKLIFFYRCKKIFLMGEIFKIDRGKNIFDGEFSDRSRKKYFWWGIFKCDRGKYIFDGEFSNVIGNNKKKSKKFDFFLQVWNFFESDFRSAIRGLKANNVALSPLRLLSTYRPIFDHYRPPTPLNRVKGHFALRPL